MGVKTKVMPPAIYKNAVGLLREKKKGKKKQDRTDPRTILLPLTSKEHMVSSLRVFKISGSELNQQMKEMFYHQGCRLERGAIARSIFFLGP